MSSSFHSSSPCFLFFWRWTAAFFSFLIRFLYTWCILNQEIKSTISGRLWLLRYWVLSRFSHVQLFVTPWTVVHQAPLSIGFSRQEYWSALSSSRGSSGPRDWIRVPYISCICRWVLYHYCRLELGLEYWCVCVCVCVCIMMKTLPLKFGAQRQC